MGATGQTIIQKVQENKQQIFKTDVQNKIAKIGTSLVDKVEAKEEEILKERMKEQEDLVKDKLAMGVLMVAKDGSMTFAKKKKTEFENAEILAKE